jgi:hypothetical protein
VCRRFIDDLNATFERLPPVRFRPPRRAQRFVRAAFRSVPFRLGAAHTHILADASAHIHPRLNQDPLVGTLTLRLENDDEWKEAVRGVVEAHVGTTFADGVSCVTFEEAFWTEVLPPPPDAAPEGPDTGFRDPVAQPRTMPVRKRGEKTAGRCWNRCGRFCARARARKC